MAYTTVINACAAADQTDLAIRLLDEMAEEKGLAPNAAACFAAARACKRAGQWERALVLIDDMEARGVPPVSAILECVADACLAAGRRDHALALLQRMRMRGLGPPEGLYAKVGGRQMVVICWLWPGNASAPHVLKNVSIYANDTYRRSPWPSRTATPRARWSCWAPWWSTGPGRAGACMRRCCRRRGGVRC